MTDSNWHIQLNKSHCDKSKDGACYCKSEIELCRSEGQEESWRSSPYSNLTRKRSLLKMTFWSRCLIALFLHIGCLAVDHRHRNSELPYEKDEMRLILGQSFPSNKLVGDENDGTENVVSLGSEVLSFHPVFLDFKESPVGMPRLGVVRVDNKLTEESVKLISISGSTVHFHSSFFADKVISPGSNTTFEVVFLSRSEGYVDSHLYIHTSKGLFKYHVQGIGLPNPYRLKPLVGVRIPVNGSYEPLITMHNPHGSRIQVVEMLSSGTDFHLSLPDSSPKEGEEGAWAIEPFQTKPVMKGTFQGKAEGNHTGYIKIRVNSTTTASEYLLVPVEVQVSSSPGIYSPQESLDFGLLVRTDKPKTLSLSLINAQKISINVQSVSVKGDPNNAVGIEFRPIAIEQDSTVSTVVALVTFDPSEANSPKDSHGFLEIKSANGDSITVPFRATVLHGELEYSKAALGFFVNTEHYSPRNFTIRNTFPTPIAIYQVTVSHPDIFELTNFNGNGSQTLPAGGELDLFEIKVRKREELCNPKSNIHLILKSNVTNLSLPITCFDGKLQVHTLSGKDTNFGRVEPFSNGLEYFSIGNSNPVEIRLRSWGSNISWAHVDLVGMQKGSSQDLAKIQDFTVFKKSLFLQPGHMAVFSIEVRRPVVEGLHWGEAFVTTDYSQTLRVPFHVSVAKGSVHSEPVLFDKVYPGKISFEKLYLSSTFNETVVLRNVWTTPTGAPLWFTSLSSQNLDIPPQRKTYVGKVHFDPKQLCGDECYSGFLLDSQLGKDWKLGSELGWEAAKLDWSILRKLQKRFDEIKDITSTNMTLWAETDSAQDFKIRTALHYTWPRIGGSKVIVFPLTAIGNESLVEISIQNPTSSPLFVQALLGSDYGPNWAQHVQGNGVGGNVTEGNMVFSLGGLGSDASQSMEKAIIFREVQKSIVKDLLHARKPLDGISFLLPPSAKFYLRCHFKPISKQVASTLLLIRNNLTGIETTWLKGRAGTGLLTLGSGIPGSSLLFQITEKLLQGCEKESASKYLPPQLTVRRSFVARNIGDIPLDITLVEIYPPQGYYWPGSSLLKQGESCEGFGFRILNCNPFSLQPNETHSIDIAYTPDFTMSRMVRSLRLIDSNGVHYNYTLVAMIPAGMLGICSTIITRPSWESTFKYVLMGVICCGFLAATCLAYFDSNSIVSRAILATVRVLPGQSKDSPNGGKEEAKVKLDLKAVYDKVDNRFKRVQQEMANQNASSSLKLSSAAQVVSSNPSLTSLSQNNSTSSGSTSIVSQNSARTEHSMTGIRNRKKNNNGNSAARTTAVSVSEPNVEKSTGTKENRNDKEAERHKERRSSLSDDVSNNNVSHTPEIKKYVEVIGKRKGKGNCGKGKNHQPTSMPNNKLITALPKLDEPSFENFKADLTKNSVDSPVELSELPPAELSKDENKVPERPPLLFNEILDENNEKKLKKERSLAKKNSGILTATGPQQLHSDIAKPQTPPNSTPSLFEPKKKVTTKQKQLSGSSSSGSHGSGSPVESFELLTPWDAPKLTSFDGLSDLLQQTPKFNGVSPRRSTWNEGNGNGSAPQLLSNPPPGYSAIPTSLSQQPPLFPQQPLSGPGNSSYPQRQHVPQSNSYIQINQPGNQAASTSIRRPGVIGQPRRTPISVPSGMPSQRTGFVHGILTTLSLAASTSTPSTRTHPALTQTVSWNSDRRGNDAEDWTSRGTGNLFPSTTLPYGKPPNPPSNSGNPATPNDLFNYNSATPADLISSLWQMNSFDSMPPTTSPYTRCTQPSGSSNALLTSTPNGLAHGYLPRVRSDPPPQLNSGFSQTQTQGNWGSSTSTSYYQGTQLDHATKNVSPALPFSLSTQDNVHSGWPTKSVQPNPSTNRTSPFERSDWGSNSGRDIWQNSLPQPHSYWPSSIGECVNRPNPATRSNPVPTTGNGIGLQNQREIEAGLGFNPFGSNIWNPPQDGDKGHEWSPPPRSGR